MSNSTATKSIVEKYDQRLEEGDLLPFLPTFNKPEDKTLLEEVVKLMTPLKDRGLRLTFFGADRPSNNSCLTLVFDRKRIHITIDDNRENYKCRYRIHDEEGKHLQTVVFGDHERLENLAIEWMVTGRLARDY